MDLNTIKKKLNKSGSGSYQTVDEVLRDLRLVWTNCLSFNAEGSDIYETAQTLSKLTDKLVAVRSEYYFQLLLSL